MQISNFKFQISNFHWALCISHRAEGDGLELEGDRHDF
jgi:hypothetical protein